jgi:hypothetical protein
MQDAKSYDSMTKKEKNQAVVEPTPILGRDSPNITNMSIHG